MNDKRKLCLGHLGIGTGRTRPFDQVYQLGKTVNPDDIYDGKVDALVIWGGEDISPSLYGEKPNNYTGAMPYLSHRDKTEVAAMNAAIATGTPIIGVCRGAQLACALAGGKLIQHVDGHQEDHTITTDEGERISTSSVHHQMMRPWDVEHKLLAWSTKQRSHRYFTEGDAELVNLPKKDGQVVEPEIVWFPKIKALAIQGHPEFMPSDTPFVKHCLKLVRQYILEEK